MHNSQHVQTEQIQRMQGTIDSFLYDKQNWARQNEIFTQEITHLQAVLNESKNYIAMLKKCCDHVRVPISALKHHLAPPTQH